MKRIVPFLWFNDNAEEAVNFYVSVFDDSRITDVRRYGEGGPGPAGAAMVVEFELEGQPFMALNGMQPPQVPEGPGGIALFVTCPTQSEVDRVWDRLTAEGEAIQCGWLRDKYGFAWNVVPEGMSDYLSGEDEERSARAMQAMLQMKKLDIEELRAAYNA